MIRITIADRVEAAIAAMDVDRLLRADRATDMCDEPRTIAHLMKWKDISLDRIGALIAQIIALEPRDHRWTRAFIRVHCGVIEAVVGLPHGAETKAALEAWEDGCDGQAWHAYLRSFDPSAETA